MDTAVSSRLTCEYASSIELDTSHLLSSIFVSVSFQNSEPQPRAQSCCCNSSTFDVLPLSPPSGKWLLLSGMYWLLACCSKLSLAAQVLLCVVTEQPTAIGK